jgi:hypothetical protein
MQAGWVVVEGNGSISIKAVRDQVLCYLEPQYRRIVAASTALVAFIKRQQQIDGIFALEDRTSPVDPHYRQYAAEGLALLKQYATSFYRDAPLWIKARVKIQRPLFTPHMGICQRETLLLQATAAVERGNCSEFSKIFIHAFLEMNQQYHVIRQARKNLFKWDIVPCPGSERFMDVGGVDEICWEGQDQEAASTFTPVGLPAGQPVCDCHFNVKLESKASTF